VVVVCCYRWWRPPQELESWQVGCGPSGVVVVVVVVVVVPRAFPCIKDKIVIEFRILSPLIFLFLVCLGNMPDIQGMLFAIVAWHRVK